MKHLIILCRVLLCAMLLLLSLSASAQTAPVAEAIPDTTTLSVTDSAMPTLPEGTVHENKFQDYIPVCAIGFELILLIVTFYMFLSYREKFLSCLEELISCRKQLKQKTYKETDKEPRQVSLTITCDEGYTAEFLRELATVIEDREGDDSSPDFEYETFHGCAEITTED